jgi:hypothetical protein
MAEMTLTIIGHAYYWGGQGFNIAFAGDPVGSIRLERSTEEERANKWKDWQAFIMRHTPLVKNTAEDNEKATKFRTKLRDARDISLNENMEGLLKKKAEYEEAFKSTEFDETIPAQLALKRRMEERIKQMNDATANSFQILHQT